MPSKRLYYAMRRNFHLFYRESFASRVQRKSQVRARKVMWSGPMESPVGMQARLTTDWDGLRNCLVVLVRPGPDVSKSLVCIQELLHQQCWKDNERPQKCHSRRGRKNLRGKMAGANERRILDVKDPRSSLNL